MKQLFVRCSYKPNPNAELDWDPRKKPDTSLPSNLEEIVEEYMQSVPQKRRLLGKRRILQVIRCFDRIASRNKGQFCVWQDVEPSSIRLAVKSSGHIEFCYCAKAFRQLGFLAPYVNFESSEDGCVILSASYEAFRVKYPSKSSREGIADFLLCNYPTLLKDLGFLNGDSTFTAKGNELLDQLEQTDDVFSLPLLLSTAFGYRTADGQLTEKGREHPHWMRELSEVPLEKPFDPFAYFEDEAAEQPTGGSDDYAIYK